MKVILTVQGSFSLRGRRDEARRYERLSGVENEVEGSSTKRKAFPQRNTALNSTYSKLGHCCSHACFSWPENCSVKKSNDLLLHIFTHHDKRRCDISSQALSDGATVAM